MFCNAPIYFPVFPLMFSPYLVSHLFISLCTVFPSPLFPSLCHVPIYFILFPYFSSFISLVASPWFFLYCFPVDIPNQKSLRTAKGCSCPPSPSTARITEGRNELHMLMSAPSIKVMALWQASCST